MTSEIEHLKSLHTALIDARNGYEEALDDAEGHGLTQLFRELMSLHGENAEAIGVLLRVMDVTASDDGSFMTTVHRTIMKVRSLFSGLDKNVLPGLIDGEERLLGYYDEAIADSKQLIHDRLVEQRAALAAKVVEMKEIKAAPS